MADTTDAVGRTDKEQPGGDATALDGTRSTATPPTTPPDYRGPRIPAPLGERLETALGLSSRPQTFAEWLDGLFAIADRDGVDLGPSALCRAENSPHRASFDGRVQHYQCVQDPIVLPFLDEAVGTVEIETVTPVDGEPVSLTVSAEDGIEAGDVDPVVSFGVAEDVGAPSGEHPSPILAYGRFCPYGHIFASMDEYERWDDRVDAVTMPTTLLDAFELARAIGQVVGTDNAQRVAGGQ